MKHFDLPEAEFAWAVGFWEGEGSIAVQFHKNRRDPSIVYWNVNLSVCQNGREAVDRFRAVVGAGSICRTQRHRSPDHWRYTLTGANAWNFAVRMQPYLSPRRYEQVDEVLQKVAYEQARTPYVRRDTLGRR